MARDPEARMSRTARAVRNGGHNASGGHTSSLARNPNTAAVARSALARQNRREWDHGRHPGDPMSYSYQEYPKHIHPDPDNLKAFVVVNSEAEEAAAKGGKPVVREEDERVRLIALAEIKDVKVDKRWTPQRMAQTIEAAGFDATVDPFA